MFSLVCSLTAGSANLLCVCRHLPDTLIAKSALFTFVSASAAGHADCLVSTFHVCVCFAN